MPAEILVTRDILAEDAVFIAQYLRESERAGRSTHMLDVRGHIANSVTLEFSDYLRFLRKHDYATLDREAHTLALTESGVRLALSEGQEQLIAQIDAFFAEKLAAGVIEVMTEEEERASLEALAGPASSTASSPSTAAVGTFASLASDAGRHITGEEAIYVRGEEIGSGPLGTVHRARHVTLGIDVAVKEFSPDVTSADGSPGPSPELLAKRLQADYSAQASLRHPAIVAVHDLDSSGPQPFAVLELCGGGNLRDRLKVQGGKGLPAAFVLDAFAQLLSGLAHAHSRGLLHHDLKGENVLFDVMGNAKLADFGGLRLREPEDRRGLLLDPAHMSYRAPETLQAAPSDAAADVYALGILFYEALTGYTPGRRSPLPSKAAPGVPEAFDELFEKMTADRPTERFSSAVEALAALHAAFPDGRYGRSGGAWVRTAPFVDG